MNEKSSSHIPRIIAIVAVVLAFVGLVVISSSQKQTIVDKVWRTEMSVGPEDANKLYVMYTDLVCPYCDVFSRAVQDHWDEFLAFLNEHKILFEVRLTNTLYLGNGYEMSRDSAEAAYCAARENKFWEYYHGAVQALWDDYHSKGIGNNKTATPITNLPEDYWQKIGHQVGLGNNFDECIKTHATAGEVEEATEKAARTAQGMPTFAFGKFTTAGFSDTWGWEEARAMLEAGLGN